MAGGAEVGEGDRRSGRRKRGRGRLGWILLPRAAERERYDTNEHQDPDTGTDRTHHANPSTRAAVPPRIWSCPAWSRWVRRWRARPWSARKLSGVELPEKLPPHIIRPVP